MEFRGQTVKVINPNHPEHEYEIGDAIASGKGNFAHLRGITRLPSGQYSTGKLLVRYPGRNWNEERYPQVFGLVIELVND